MPRENKTKFAILGLIANRPSSGYDIKKRFSEHLGKFWSESYGQIYPIVKSLEEEGLAISTVEHTDGKPSRHVYSITDKGLEELQAWLRRPTDPHKERLEVLLKLVYGAHVSIDESIELVQRFKDEWTAHTENYARTESVLRAEFQGQPYLPYSMMAVSCGMHIGNAYIAWCDETINSLTQMRENTTERLTEES